MRTFTVDGGKAGPCILITAGVHGDEYEPMYAAREIVRKLDGKLCRGKVMVVVNTNDSACARGTREGEDGLDLARICPGDAGGSPSQIAAAQVSKLIRACDHYIDLHTGGRLFDIYPLAGYMLHNDPAVLKKQRIMARAFNLPVVWGTDDRPEGRTLSIARDAGVPAIYIEYGGGDAIRQGIVDAYVDGCCNVMTSLGMVEGGLGAHGLAEAGSHSGVGYMVEDPTPDGGHLQSKMPAPAEGVFVSVVKPGDRIHKGDVWGHITNFDKDRQYSVAADKDGIALFVRRHPFVKEGDPLGGILPIDNPEKSW
jgi:predicted deacylase